jgi:hypothetical protein
MFGAAAFHTSIMFHCGPPDGLVDADLALNGSPSAALTYIGRFLAALPAAAISST